jgi:hypothetical protein
MFQARNDPAGRRPSRARRPRGRSRASLRRRLGLEPLEERHLLAVVNWTNPSGGDWDNPKNWGPRPVAVPQGPRRIEGLENQETSGRPGM